MNRVVSDWYEKKEHIDEMKDWDKGRLKIWEQQVTDRFQRGAKILDIGSGMGREAFNLYRQGFEGNRTRYLKILVELIKKEQILRHYSGMQMIWKKFKIKNLILFYAL
ncbi:MAG TPA: hypothetical protein VN258_12590 [Mobilitalea sp.]|nr:hypothetical protein [Mobilitalea sp.]